MKVSYKKKELLALHGHLSSLRLFVGSMFVIVLVFRVVFFCVVPLCPVSCVPDVASFSGLSIRFSLTFVHICLLRFSGINFTNCFNSLNLHVAVFIV